MSQVNLRAGATAPPQFNSAQGVMGEIQGELAHLGGLWQELAGIMRSIEEHKSAKPEPTDTSGMKKEDADKAHKSDGEKMDAWSRTMSDLEGSLRQCQEKIEQSTQKLAQLQNTKLPTAQNKDRGDMDRWMEDQRKAQEALAQSTGGAATQYAVGGSENAETIRAQLGTISVKMAAVQALLNNDRVVNVSARQGQLSTTVGRTPPRNDGLTIG
jgi:chromosome segregation ATPase